MTTSDQAIPPVPRTLRVVSFLLATLLTFLFVWLLGFVLADLDDIQGPDYQSLEQASVDPELFESQRLLEERQDALAERIAREQEIQSGLRDAMDNARGTMQQMMDLHQLALEQGLPPDEADQQTLARAQQRFLDSQDAYDAANGRIGAAREERFEVEQQLAAVLARLDQAREPVRSAYEEQRGAHRLRVAAYKLGFIVPLFLLSAWAYARHRQGTYRSILFAALAACFWKVGRVMFDVFPREYFKYIAITAAIAIVLGFLAWLLRKAARPDPLLLVTRYREAYRAHACPLCAHPIARGPLRFAVWTRKGPRLGLGAEPALVDDLQASTPYVCPSCGTRLFEECTRCGTLRHSLLPYCERCGDERPVGAGDEVAT